MPDNDEIMEVDLVSKCIKKKSFRDENLINHLLEENEMKQKLFLIQKCFINLWYNFVKSCDYFYIEQNKLQ